METCKGEKERREKDHIENEQNKEQNKQEQIPIDDSYYPHSPQYVPSAESDNFATTITETLVPVSEGDGEEEERE